MPLILLFILLRQVKTIALIEKILDGIVYKEAFKKLRGMLYVPLDFGLGEFLLVMKLEIIRKFIVEGNKS
jgi:hypothetical protein